MAYGQTGTGKTYTIVQELIPQSLNWIFQNKPVQDDIYFSCLQIYNEKLSDLLCPNNKVQMREKKNRFVVERLVEEKVVNVQMGRDLISKCENNRNIGSTSMNPYSSRSHAIYMYKIFHKEKGIFSTLYFVDLAGSERLKVLLYRYIFIKLIAKKSKIHNDKYSETISINTSLTTLGKCIIALTEKRSTHVPYRESKLTKVLMETLSGNSMVSFIVNLSAKLGDIGKFQN